MGLNIEEINDLIPILTWSNLSKSKPITGAWYIDAFSIGGKLYNMTSEELWEKSGLTGTYEAWPFGEAPDKLADLVLQCTNKFQLVDMFPITGKCPKPVDMFLTNRKNVDMFLDAILRTGSGQWTCSREPAQV